jgi:RimJ/RimL family protein N-acetyltransferase
MILRTKRLTIRPFAKTDLDEFKKLLDIPEVPGWQMQRDKAEDFLNWHIGNYSRMDIVHGVVCLGIFHTESGYVLGAVGAGEHDDLHKPEIFYNLLPSARGKGYAVEAVMAVTKWVFENYEIEYLIGTTEVSNTPSQRVLEKCGYHFVDERDLLVHIENRIHTYKYYERYNPKYIDHG